MKIIFTLCIVLQGISLLRAQEASPFTAEQKAYLFHIVRKSPILEANIGRYFEYKGPDVRFPNKEINYDSIESIIIQEPEKLFIRTSEIAKSPKGLLAEAANKMALWELNKVLLAKRLGDKELQHFLVPYQQFEAMLTPLLPPNAFKSEDGKQVPHPKLDNLLNPGLSFDDKKSMIASFHFLEPEDQLQTLKALNAAVNQYVEQRTYAFFQALGGQALVFDNILVAAGDGSSTTGLLEEREKDEKGRWNKGLPKAVGLFPYQVILKPGEKQKKPVLEPMRFTTNDLQTAGNQKLTNLHFDVWGYNAEKQTTVVIEKNGLSYHLFGSGETRFLSPDSAFSKGATFQTIINDLKNNKIAKLQEMIYGKRGFDYWIAYYEKRKTDQTLKIEKTEKELSDLRYSPITTSAKAKKRGGINTVNTTSGKKPRKIKQELLVQQYNQLEEIKRKIAELKKQKEEAIDLLAQYQRRLDLYNQLMGLHWASYTEKDGLYMFQDSTTFDILTQEFQFPPTVLPQPFEVRLLAIPYSALSDEVDEVMLHINLADALPDYDARIQLSLEDVFASDSWQLPRNLFTPADSVAVRQFFEAMLNKKLPFEVIARGQGIGTWNGSRTVQAFKPVELKSYPGTTEDAQLASKMDSSFLRLRKSEVLIDLNRKITLQVNSYTDPVASGLAISNAEILETMRKYNLSKNQVLSAYRTAAILRRLKEELNVLAGTYLDRQNAKIVIDRLNNEIAKARIAVGPTSFKIAQLVP